MHAGLNVVGDALARHAAVRRTAGRLLALCCSLAAILGFTGCASYQLGTGGGAPKFATLFIAPVRAEALIPQAEVLVTTQLREAFLRDGRLTLVNSAETADVVLQVVLTGYGREVAVSLQDDTGLARRFDVTLAAHATLTDTRSRQVIFDHRPLTAQLGVFTDSGLVPAEYQGLPLLAESLAKEAVHTVLDTW